MQITFLQIVGWVVGLALAGAGLWTLRRWTDPGRAGSERVLSNSSRAAVGVSLLVAGYHIAAYLGPDDWFLLRVPLKWAWILALALVFMVGSSLLMDRRERRGEAGEPEARGSGRAGRR